MPKHAKTPAQPPEQSLLQPRESGPLRIALVFPNTYYVGMSSLGFQAVFRLFSEHPQVTCERFFLPDHAEIEKLQRTGKPLCSFETHTPLDRFHIVAFSLSFENDYLNILTMLKLGRVQVLQADRGPRNPLVIAGGVAAFLNPEPLADFFDLFIIGEAEQVLNEFSDAAAQQLKAQGDCRDLEAYKDIRGIYIPSGYRLTYGQDGCLASRQALPGYPERIACRQSSDIEQFSTTSCLFTRDTEFGDMALVEVSRGCARACRFCAVGSIYHPYRVRSKSSLLEAVRRLGDRGKRAGLLGAAVSDYPDFKGLLHALQEAGTQISVSSLRADALDEDIVGLLQQCGHKTFTIAPEAGSERLRKVIGKHLTAGQIEQAVRVLSNCRVPGIKLYFMIGLPTETDEDIKAIIELVRHVKHVYFQQAQSEKWLNTIQVSVSPFVPKPWTPFQWAAFTDTADLKHRLKMITSGLRSERKVAVSCDLPKWGYVQTLLSRADRRVGKLLQRVFELNGDWNRAFRTSDINPDFFVYRERQETELFPWDFIEHRVKKEKLWREYQKGLAAQDD